jgi:hypothetical protein
MKIRSLLFTCCILGLSFEQALAQKANRNASLDAEDAGRLDSADVLRNACDDYLDGKIKGRALSRLIDHTLKQAADAAAKSALLSEVLTEITGQGNDNTPKEVDDFVFLYSSQLLAISKRPAEVVDALLHIVTAKETEAQRTSGSERTANLTSALQSCIEASKIISENLKQPERVALPGVDPYVPGESGTLAHYNAQRAARAAAEAHNSLVESGDLIKDGMEMEHLKKKLNISDQDFAKMWTEVKTRKFDPNWDQQLENEE